MCNHFPPTKAKINALAYRIKQMRLNSQSEAILLSLLRALYVLPNTLSTGYARNYLNDAYYSILELYGIDDLSLLEDK